MMKAGFHSADITPIIGMEAPGDYRKAYVQAIHDPLKVRAAVFDDERCPIALVGVDTCILPSDRSFIQRARDAIEQRTGIPGANVLVAASHTHSGGPFAWGLPPGEVEGAPKLVRELVQDHSIAADPRYCDWVEGQVMTAVCEAHRRRQPARLSVGTGAATGVAFNRRFRMRNGRVYTHPGKGNPDIIESAGPTDPAVAVIGGWSDDGDLLGCVVNFSCHCTTFGGAVSADYVCYLEQLIQAAHGESAEVVFLNGACGDVTQVDNQSTRESEFGEKWSRIVGTRVGAEALHVLASAPFGDLAPLAVATETVPMRRRLPSAERLEEARNRVLAGLADGARDTAWTFAKELVMLDYIAQVQPIVEVELQALQIGPAAFIANPAELFCALGLRMKAGSPFPYTFVVELANGCVGYVPDAAAFAPGGGGYETVLTSYSSLQVGAGDILVERATALLSKLAPSPPLALPQVEWSGEAWSYGVLGPDLE